MRTFLLFTLLLILSTKAQYCKPYCTVSTCSTVSNDCTGCILPLTGTAGCTMTSTTYSSVEELPAESSFTISGYTSNVALATTQCTDSSGFTYNMMGPFTVDNYIYKEFSGLGTNHY